MPDDKSHPDSEILEQRRITDESFWTKKISDVDELARRQAEYSRDVSAHPDVIFYESMSGARMMDSPYALFRHWLEHPQFKGFHHVWSVRSNKLIADEYRNDPRVSFVTRGTDAHLYFLARASHIVGNSVLPEHFVRKADQKYLNTWHGIAYKGIGRDSTSPLGAAASVYNMLQATHVLTPCPFMSDMQLERLSLRGVHAGSIAEIGYPRQDLTVNVTEGRLAELRSELGLDPNRKTVLYAPTWRGNKGSARFDADQLEADLARLTRLDANIVFQAHHIMLRHIKNVDYGSIIIPPANMVTNELLTVADLLISDYSSIFFDYLVTDRPVVHYVYDYADYAAERGVTLERSELPGEVVDDPDDLVPTLEHLLDDSFVPPEKYRRAKERFCPHDDGRASERTTRWFFDNHSDGIEIVRARTRPSTLFFGGRLDKTSATEAFLESVAEVAAAGDRDVSLFVAHSVKSNPAAIDRIRRLPPSVSVIARSDYEVAMTSEEKEARYRSPSLEEEPEPPVSTEVRSESTTLRTRLGRLFSRSRTQTQTSYPDQNQQTTPIETPAQSDSALRDTIYAREYRRIFGDSTFDQVVEFANISPFWKRLAEHAGHSR